jgi:hypothetical protein
MSFDRVIVDAVKVAQSLLRARLGASLWLRSSMGRAVPLLFPPASCLLDCRRGIDSSPLTRTTVLYPKPSMRALPRRSPGPRRRADSSRRDLAKKKGRPPGAALNLLRRALCDDRSYPV